MHAFREIDEKIPAGTDPDYANVTPTALPYLNGVSVWAVP